MDGPAAGFHRRSAKLGGNQPPTDAAAAGKNFSGVIFIARML
jgi:hypothetical protein